MFGERGCVWDSHLRAAADAVKHLLNSGRKNILFLGMGTGFEVEEEKIAGYKLAHRESGRPVNKDYFIYDKNILKNGGVKVAAWLAKGVPVDAVFAVNDHTAKAVMTCLLAKGVKIPEDIALLGADDMPGVDRWPVPLATIRRPREKIGRELVRALLRRYDHSSAGGEETVLECEFIKRQSAGGGVR